MQGSIYIGEGTQLLSDQARTLMRVTADTCGRQDTLAGCCSAASNRLRYGVENTPSCHANFTAKLERWGLGSSAIVPNINGLENAWADQTAFDNVRSGVSRRSSTAARTTATQWAPRGDWRIRRCLAILAFAISATQPSGREVETGRPARWRDP